MENEQISKNIKITIWVLVAALAVAAIYYYWTQTPRIKKEERPAYVPAPTNVEPLPETEEFIPKPTKATPLPASKTPEPTNVLPLEEGGGGSSQAPLPESSAPPPTGAPAL